jgi:hypothetical protein
VKGTELDAPPAVVMVTCADGAPFDGGTVTVQLF